MPQAERQPKMMLAHAIRAIAVSVSVLALGCSSQLSSERDEGGHATAGQSGAGETGSGGQAGNSDNVLPPLALARRLTREQYAFVVKDVLGVSLDPKQLEALPAEPLLDGFSGLAANLTVFSAHAQGYWDLADVVVRGISNFDGLVAKHTTCTKTTDACRQAFVSALGRRLFRRPLDAREIEVFSTLFAKLNDLGESFSAGAQAVLSAMLQAPSFLYRMERTGPTPQAPASGHEIANRLSFLLWSSAPNDALLDAADSGALNDGDGIVAFASEMLLDEKARRSSERFARDFLRLDTLLDPGVQREGLTEGLRAELASAAVAFYQDHVWQRKQPLKTLFTSGASFLSPTMAAWYGLTPNGTGIKAYELTNTVGAAGWLSQPGAMAGTADRDAGGMVARGLYMERNVFCGEPTPPPPADIDLEANSTHLGDASERAYSEDRLSRPSCGACHARFEPLAYAFERFDGLGRHRTKDKNGNELRQDGWIPEDFDEAKPAYNNLEAYGDLLENNANVQRCLTQKQLEFALGESLGGGEGSIEAAFVNDIHKRFAMSEGRYSDFVMAFIAHPAFRAQATR